MDIDTFYTDHWKEIEDERIERYEGMFQWRDAHAQMLAPADLQNGKISATVARDVYARR